MKIIILLIIDLLKKIIRRLYWLYRLIQAKKGSNFSIKFPVKTEGYGNLSFGNNCKVKKNVYFACGKGCEIIFGDNCRIDENVQIIAGKKATIKFADNCWIMRNTIIRTSNIFEFESYVNIATNCAVFSREDGHEGTLKVGKGTHIGDNTIIDVADDITIENEIAIGPNCVIYTHDHDYTKSEKAAWKGGIIKHPVTIKKGAWIASSVTILPKVELGERCVVAAGAVVTKNTDSNSIYGGIPAKKIKEIN
jgi:acetyltransferase-like isoleucine patch superfamily enzyme